MPGFFFPGAWNRIEWELHYWAGRWCTNNWQWGDMEVRMEVGVTWQCCGGVLAWLTSVAALLAITINGCWDGTELFQFIPFSQSCAGSSFSAEWTLNSWIIFIYPFDLNWTPPLSLLCYSNLSLTHASSHPLTCFLWKCLSFATKLTPSRSCSTFSNSPHQCFTLCLLLLQYHVQKYIHLRLRLSLLLVCIAKEILKDF